MNVRRGRPFIAFIAFAAFAGGCRQSAPRDDSGASPRACAATADCAPADFCDFEPGLCGKGKRAGVCRTRAASCANAATPVCGCDGAVYASECAANQVGADLAVNGGCHGGPPSYAACGARFCDVRVSYCEIVLSDVPDPPTDYACKPLPPSCIDGGAEPTCDCFPKGTRCASFCGPIETSGGRRGIHLTCRL